MCQEFHSQRRGSFCTSNRTELTYIGKPPPTCVPQRKGTWQLAAAHLGMIGTIVSKMWSLKMPTTSPHRSTRCYKTFLSEMRVKKRSTPHSLHKAQGPSQKRSRGKGGSEADSVYCTRQNCRAHELTATEPSPVHNPNWGARDSWGFWGRQSQFSLWV